MKLYMQLIKLLFNRFILRKNAGTLIKDFCLENGIVYIKMAQMLSTQNYKNLFTEEDRKQLADVCDDCNKLPYSEIEQILKKEYGDRLEDIFKFIDKNPTGSASVSQVHRAILNTGEEVAIKIKRQDVAKTMQEDIQNIRKIVHKFGKIVKFRNFTGGDHALDLYLGWIEQETDFNHERENIKLYQNFADNVNGKVSGTKKIKVPRLYEEYCTDNIIVMEFINSQTIKKMPLVKENKDKIVNAINSYIKSSFWAMFNDKQIVFHGDPHTGNICIDENGNICFLDMGLLFYLSDSDAKLILKFFLTAYLGDYEKLYDMLVNYGDMSEKKKISFKKQCKEFCEELKEKELSYYFTDMINICIKYNFNPPDFLFFMAKAFVCINGIGKFSDNLCTAKELLQEQVAEFLIKRSLNDCKQIAKDSLHMAPEVLKNTSQYGLVNAIAKATTSSEIRRDVIKSLENLKEMLDLIKITYQDEAETQMQQSSSRPIHL